jgi:hypothetical protein
MLYGQVMNKKAYHIGSEVDRHIGLDGQVVVGQVQ